MNRNCDSLGIRSGPSLVATGGGKYSCQDCEKSFKKPSDLERHIRTHTGERPFRCEVCGKSFSLKSTLGDHLKVRVVKRL